MAMRKRRFHMSDDGPRPCRAAFGRCPVSGENMHGDTVEETLQNYEKAMEHQTLVATQQKASSDESVFLVNGKVVKVPKIRKVEWANMERPRAYYEHTLKLFRHYSEISEARKKQAENDPREVVFDISELPEPQLMVAYDDGTRVVAENPNDLEKTAVRWYAPGGGARETRNVEGLLHGANLLDRMRDTYGAMDNGVIHSENGSALFSGFNNREYFYRGVPISAELFSAIKTEALKKREPFDVTAKRLLRLEEGLPNVNAGVFSSDKGNNSGKDSQSGSATFSKSGKPTDQRVRFTGKTAEAPPMPIIPTAQRKQQR